VIWSGITVLGIAGNLELDDVGKLSCNLAGLVAKNYLFVWSLMVPLDAAPRAGSKTSLGSVVGTLDVELGTYLMSH